LYGLADAIVFDDELFGLDPIYGLTRFGLNPCREQDEVRVYGEFVIVGIGLLAGGQAREKKRRCRE
jgi:hypothetical protein